TRDTRNREHRSRRYSRRCRRNHYPKNHTPLRRTQRERSFAQTMRHKLQHFFCSARYDRNHDQRERNTASECRKMFGRHYEDRVNKNSSDNRRYTSQRVDDEPYSIAESPTSNLRQVNPNTDSERQAEGSRNQKQQERTDNCISDSATFTNGA